MRVPARIFTVRDRPAPAHEVVTSFSACETATAPWPGRCRNPRRRCMQRAHRPTRIFSGPHS